MRGRSAPRGGPRGRPPRYRSRSAASRARLAWAFDLLEERQRPGFDFVHAVGGDRGVAVFVDAVAAEHALAIFRAVDLRDDVGALRLFRPVAGRPFDRVE